MFKMFYMIFFNKLIMSNYVYFQDWYSTIADNDTFHPYVPDDRLHNGWFMNLEASHRRHTMWEQWYYYYCYERNLWSVFSNVRVFHGNDKGLVLNRRENGLHFNGKTVTKSDKRLLDTWNDSFIQLSDVIPLVNFEQKIWREVRLPRH